MKLKLGSYRVFAVGIVIGLAAAVVQAFFKVQPPEAYGVSFIGHPNDLFTWLTNKTLHTAWPVHEEFLVYPALTVVGVLIGSFIAAGRNKELRWQPGPIRNKFAAVILGFLVVNLGLLLGSCPLRAALLVSYGSVLAVIAWAAIALGVFLAILYSRRRAQKGVVR